MNTGPLAGRSIIVTRARHQASQLSSRLAEMGAEVIEIPAIEIVPPASYEPLDRALRNLSEYQFLIVTSANTARVLGERTALLGIDGEVWERLTVVAIGSATTRALQKAGINVRFMPEEYVAESLLAGLGHTASGKCVLLARASVARDLVPDLLRQSGANVDVVDAYRTVLPQESVLRLRLAIETCDRFPDAVTFTSSSTVTNFLHLLAESGHNRAGLRAISIGPITSATLREHGWEPAAEAAQHDVEGIVRATLALLSSA